MSCWVWGLVSVALVVLLAAIVFPIFAKGPRPHRQTTCLSNLKQVALASLMYAQDYDEVFVRMPGWDDALDPYIKNRDVFHCPSDRRKVSLSYGMNPHVAGLSVPTRQSEDAQSLVLPDDAATIVAFYDGEGPEIIERHNDGANFAFMDGHAKWLGHPPEDSGLYLGEVERR